MEQGCSGQEAEAAEKKVKKVTVKKVQSEEVGAGTSKEQSEVDKT